MTTKPSPFLPNGPNVQLWRGRSRWDRDGPISCTSRAATAACVLSDMTIDPRCRQRECSRCVLRLPVSEVIAFSGVKCYATCSKLCRTMVPSMIQRQLVYGTYDHHVGNLLAPATTTMKRSWYIHRVKNQCECWLLVWLVISVVISVCAHERALLRQSAAKAPLRKQSRFGQPACLTLLGIVTHAQPRIA